MKKNYLLWALLVLFKLGQGQSIEPFKDGDRVVFAGNSITEAGLYENYIWLYYITHLPEVKLRIFNAGIGGDVAGQIYDRLAKDIMEKDPSVLVVTFGMNDSKYFEYQDTSKTVQTRKAAVDTSYANFLKIAAFLKARPTLRKIIMSSSPYDETMQNEKNYFPGKSQTMEEIASFQQTIARRNQWEYVDLLHPMLAITHQEQAKQPNFTLTGPDRIHPGSAGHLVMAYLFLKAQGLAGKPVADLAIDAALERVLKNENADIRSLKSNKSSVTFNYLAKSLPFPIDTLPRVWENKQTQKDALDVIPFMAEFNQERMMVKGLKAGDYVLKIDGEWIGTFSAAEWAKGINLAEITHTPQYKQALELMELNRKHRELEIKFRNYYWVNYNFLKDKKLLFDDSEVAHDTVMKHQEDNGWLRIKTADYEQIRKLDTRSQLEREMASLREEMYRLNKPRAHRVTITAI